MEIKFDTSELDDLQQKLEEFDGEHQVPLAELLPDEFIQRFSDYQTLNDMLDASGIGEDGDLDSPEFSEFIKQHTQFNSWNDMASEAAGEWTKRKLNL